MSDTGGGLAGVGKSLSVEDLRSENNPCPWNIQIMESPHSMEEFLLGERFSKPRWFGRLYDLDMRYPKIVDTTLFTTSWYNSEK